MKKIGLIHEEESYVVRGLIYEIRKRLDVGWPEEAYHQALLHLLKSNGIPVDSKPRKSIVHRGVEVHTFEADLLVWDKIVLELKVLPRGGFASAHIAQIIHYLKCWQMDLGFLVNYGEKLANIQRIVWSESRQQDVENYEQIGSILTESDRVILNEIRQVVETIAELYGLGYPETLYRQVLAIELELNGIHCLMNADLPVRLGTTKLMEYQSDHLLVQKNYLINVRSIVDNPSSYDFIRMKTFLKSLELRFGLIINFSKRQLQIYGVNPS